MLKDGDFPLVGQDSNMLGVRIPPHSLSDVTPDSSGQITPNGQGLSVNGDWRLMRLNHIPDEFKHIVKKARGGSQKAIWKLGEGEFLSSPINEELQLEVDSANHGVIQPVAPIQVDEFQMHLAATQDSWQRLRPEDVNE